MFLQHRVIFHTNWKNHNFKKPRLLKQIQYLFIPFLLINQIEAKMIVRGSDTSASQRGLWEVEVP